MTAGDRKGAGQWRCQGFVTDAGCKMPCSQVYCYEKKVTIRFGKIDAIPSFFLTFSHRHTHTLGPNPPLSPGESLPSVTLLPLEHFGLILTLPFPARICSSSSTSSPSCSSYFTSSHPRTSRTAVYLSACAYMCFCER